MSKQTVSWAELTVQFVQMYGYGTHTSAHSSCEDAPAPTARDKTNVGRQQRS